MKRRPTKKRVLIMGINFSPELTGIGKYTGEMADWLVENDYHCTVLTAFPYYPNWNIQKPYSGRSYKKETLKDGGLEVYRCPIYVPQTPSGIKRVLHDASFFFSALFMTIYLLFKQGNDHIFCMAPPFHLGFLAMFYRFFKGGKMIYHIHDLQIEAARDLKVIKTQSIFSILFSMERFIINHADHVSTISAGMMQKVSKKTEKEIILFPNWVDIHLFRPLAFKEHLKKKWGFESTDKIVLYSGSIGEKQGLESLIAIAKRLEVHDNIKFVICGNGPYRDKMEQLAHNQQLSNMHFMPLQPIHLFNELLNMPDVHLVLQKKNACDLMMPSKLTAIWSAGGLAIVTAEKGTTLHTAINKHKMGIVIPCENEGILTAAILDCCTADHSRANANGRSYAKKFLNKHNILQRLMHQIEEPGMLLIYN